MLTRLWGRNYGDAPYQGGAIDGMFDPRLQSPPALIESTLGRERNCVIPQVWLSRSEIYSDQLPAVCARCGEPTPQTIRKTFTWVPYWARFLGRFGSSAYRKQMSVRLPVCRRHRNHWLWRSVIIWGVFGLIFLPGLFGMLLREWWGPALVVAWGVLERVLHYTAIRADEITDDGMQLNGLSPRFVVALKQQTIEGETLFPPTSAEDALSSQEPWTNLR